MLEIVKETLYDFLLHLNKSYINNIYPLGIKNVSTYIDK